MYESHFEIAICSQWEEFPERTNCSKELRLIEPFQKGETPTFLAHIKEGIRLLGEQPGSLLVFSG